MERDASWLPPREQQPPHQWAPPGPTPYGDAYDTVSTGRPDQPSAATQPYGVAPPPATSRRSGVPGWLWPTVSVLALIVGVVGGMLGGAAYETWHASSREGQVGGGLADAGTVSQAPLPAGNHSVASVAQQLLPSTIQVSRSTRARRTARPAPASSSTARATTSPTTTWSPTRSATTARSRSSTRTATSSPPRSSGAARYDLAVLDVKGRNAAAPGSSTRLLGASRRRPGRRGRLPARAQRTVTPASSAPSTGR